MKSLKDSFPEPTRNFHERIITTLGSLPEKKESIIMKKNIVLRRCIITAVCAAVVLGTAALARGPIFSKSAHSWGTSYTEFPTQDIVEKDTGIKNINIPEAFSNGYAFKSGRITDNFNYDEKGNILDKYKSVAYTYTNAGGTVSIYTSSSEYEEPQQEDQHTVLAEEYNGSKLYYVHYKAKYLPPDYEMTAEDKADEESGKYVFNYGTDKVEIDDVQQVIFETDGKNIDILCSDESAGRDELLGMAKEIIGIKTN